MQPHQSCAQIRTSSPQGESSDLRVLQDLGQLVRPQHNLRRASLSTRSFLPHSDRSCTSPSSNVRDSDEQAVPQLFS